ncbi:MAG: GNAT family N-acetyltransferase [Thermomicrobiales bacterium]
MSQSKALDLDNSSFNAAANLAASLAAMARSIGGRDERWDDAWAVDARSPHPLPNSVALLKPLSNEHIGDLAGRIRSFFTAGSGGPSLIWSFWPASDEDANAFASYGFMSVPGPPLMYRPAGAPEISYPPELDIVEVHDDATVLDFETTFVEAYPVPEMQPFQPGRIVSASALGGPLRLWVGYVDGKPVTTAIAHVEFDVVGVYWISTLPDARGRGYGTAMTDIAARAQPDLPAVLQSSDLGGPIYERMGFISMGKSRMWFMPKIAESRGCLETRRGRHTRPGRNSRISMLANVAPSTGSK